MKKLILLALFPLFSIQMLSQNSIAESVGSVGKGEYVILEVRMQMEDVFQTIEGNSSGNLSRIAIFAGKNKGKELISKGFQGFGEVVQNLNQLQEKGFNLVETYNVNGSSLLITHYVLIRKKVK